MIIDIIRGIIQSVTTGASQAYRTFTATGRANEIISGKQMQHYGFTSKPPAGTDIVALQYGNNCVSVAENSGNITPTLSNGQVAIYADGRTASQVSIIQTPDTSSSDGLISIICKNGAVTISAGNDVTITLEQDKVIVKAPNVYLGDSTSTQVLMTKAYADALVSYMAQIVTGFLAVPYTLPAFVAPVNGLTSNTEAK